MELLHLNTPDPWGWIIICCYYSTGGFSMLCSMISGIPDLYLLGASSIPFCHLWEAKVSPDVAKYLLVGKISYCENHWSNSRNLYFQTLREDYENEKSRRMPRWGKKLYLPFHPPPHILLSVFLIALLLGLSCSREARRIVSNGESMTTKHGGKVRLGRL